MKRIAAIDLFCGAGAMTHGFVKEGIPVVAGIDIDSSCRYAFEENNGAQFILRDVDKLEAQYWSGVKPL